ncbi:hypothetical protein GSbR_08460 [Geobacter sp. SVR]|nr:hypothetical protein GSVR_18650 [Geobacter sp. SVR]GCF84246.1 hypothetical protein GSbR_08460 [Geobacter sp. SVR]
MPLYIDEFCNGEPILYKCHTRHVRDELYRCLLEKSDRCRYAAPSGAVIYCTHENRSRLQGLDFLDHRVSAGATAG